jgi:hypothetical protein
MRLRLMVHVQTGLGVDGRCHEQEHLLFSDRSDGMIGDPTPEN